MKFSNLIRPFDLNINCWLVTEERLNIEKQHGAYTLMDPLTGNVKRFLKFNLNVTGIAYFNSCVR
jgi:hypothetical protein